MVVVKLAAIALVACRFMNAHFVLWSDNKGVCGAIGNSCRSLSNICQNIILRHTVSLFREYNIWFTMSWVLSRENFTDRPSCGLLPPVCHIMAMILSVPYHCREWVSKPVQREIHVILCLVKSVMKVTSPLFFSLLIADLLTHEQPTPP
jgi:hypothetical protein